MFNIGKGFSLVEILVSLFVVSMAAVNITGLQQMVGGQNRDNFTHSAVLKLATEKMEEVLQFKQVTELEALPSLCSKEDPCVVTDEQTNTPLGLVWEVATLAAAYNAGADLREVKLQIDWQDSKGDQQVFTYSEQINLAQLLRPNGGGPASVEAAIIESFLKTNEVIYFEPKMGYKQGSFVIYNSDLYQATAIHSVGNGHPRNIANPAVDSEGWTYIGSIDNKELAKNSDLKTLFLDTTDTEADS